MDQAHGFASWLALHFERFVALKRARGARYVVESRRLEAFDRYLNIQAPLPPLQRETLVQYLGTLQDLSPRTQYNVVSVLWAAVTYARDQGARIEVLPARPPKPPRHGPQRQPRIVSQAEAASLLAAARELPPLDGLRAATTATLLGLLYTTGVRIGEALALDVGDLDSHHRLLTVRRGKFGKSRELPLCESTVLALESYLAHPLRRVGTDADAPIFVSGRQRRLAVQTVRPAIEEACRTSGISRPWPRPHDFRHTFTVSRVATWYEQGRDLNVLLPALSTYLGHVSVENTRLYLIANGSLLEHAATRFAHQTRALDEVLS